MTTGLDVSPDLLPVIDVGEARTTAIRLRTAAGAATNGLAQLDRAAPPAWWGGASEAYYSNRGGLSRRLVDIQANAEDLAGAVARYADGVETSVASMRRAASRLRLAEQRASAATLLDDGPALWQREVADARVAFDREVAGYQQVVAELLRAADRISASLEFEAESVGDHLIAGIQRFGELAVVEPAQTLWSLTVGGLEDPAGWRAAVSAIPGALWEQVRHPLRTLDEMLGGPEYRSGKWGAGIGTTLSAAVGTKLLKRVAPDDVQRRFARNMADPKAPRPRTQTVDELFERVDLLRNEHYELGHTIRRHVDVDDEYLRHRLEQGTLLDNGQYARGKPPSAASAFNDLPTAELAITQALRANREAVLQFAGGKDGVGTFVFTADEPLGRVMFMGRDGPQLVESSKVVVRLGRKDNEIYVVTAYLEKINE